MTFPKRTFDKPIPISPLIALDRERCILCYRCTRFSEEVAEDGQLVARNRGAQSMIATFEDEPYRAPFSGNVIELCPVGALTSTQYRFEARPWEIQNVPTVCGLCPVGCNISATTREGKVKRIQSRNHPEIDEGWLCDKGRFAYPHLYARDRITDPARARAPARLRGALLGRCRSTAPPRCSAARTGRSSPLCPAPRRSSSPTRSASSCATVLGAHTAMLPEETSDALDAFRLPLSAIRDAEIVVVLGDEPVSDRAPIADMWVKLARRNGAEVVTVGPDGDVQAAPGGAADALRGATELTERIRAGDRTVLIWSGGGGHGGVTLAALANELGLAGKEGSGAFHLPSAPNARGVADAWACAADETSPNPQPIKLLIVSGDEAAADPNVRTLAEHAEQVLAIAMFGQLLRGWADLVLPGTSYLERDGTYDEPRGTPPAPPPHGHPARRPTSSPGWPSWRRGSTSSSRRIRRRSSPRSRREPSAGCRSARSASRRRFRRAQRPTTKPPSPPRPRRRRREEARSASSATGRSSPAPPWNASTSCSSSGPRRSSSWRPRMRPRGGSRTAIWCG